MDLLRELCEASGIAGREERLRAIVKRELEPHVDEMRVDRLGNVIGLRKGSAGKSLALNAHMDEIGFLVNHIEEEGFLRITPVGGHDPRNMVAQRVTVIGKRDLPGVLYPGQKPPHILTPEERNKIPQIPSFFVDVGLPEDEVRELVPVGSQVVIYRQFAEVGGNVCCKAMDNRVSLYIMLEAMRRTRKAGLDVYAVATVQEEVGLRGAITSTYDIYPDVGLALDVTLAADIPGVEKPDYTSRLGGGTAIKIMDSSSISSPQLVEALRTLAEERNIQFQMEILRAGGTDAGGMQRVRAGVPVGTISTPTRYVHTSIESCSKADIEASIALTCAFIEEGHRFDLSPR